MGLNTTFIGAGYFEDLSVCDELIDYFQKNPDLLIEGKSARGLNTEVKKSLDCCLEYIDPSLREKYFEQLKKVLILYKKNYNYCDEMCAPWGIVDQPNFQKYEPGGGFYSWHSERNGATIPMAFRHLVFMTYLNDVTDGGETEFFYQKLKVQPKKGLTLIWPADWTHTHRGITSPTQTKYIVTGWYSFIPKDT
jgi:hypothetical protein